MPIHERKENQIIHAYVQQAWLQELPLEKPILHNMVEKTLIQDT